jgi:hypothetical protein
MGTTFARLGSMNLGSRGGMKASGNRSGLAAFCRQLFAPRIFLIDACSSLYNSASSLVKADQGISTPLRPPLGTSLNPWGVTVRRYDSPLILRFSRTGTSDLVDTVFEASKRYSCARLGRFGGMS